MAKELKTVRYDGHAGYYVLAIEGLEEAGLVDFFIGREGYAVLEHCFGIPEQSGRLTDAEYAEVCFDGYTQYVEAHLEE